MSCPAVLRLAAILPLGLAAAFAVDGPGFPNVDYLPSQEGTVLSLNDPGKALSSMTMHRGYLFVPLGADHGGGAGAGAFAFYDISDPANVTTHFDSRNYPADYHTSGQVNYAGDFAEIHHLPVSGDLMMISEKRNGSAGYSILDAGNLYDADPATIPQIVSRFSYPGVTSPTNYDGYSFALGWQGRKYLWGPTGSNGLMIVDTSDLANPQLVANIPRSQLGNLTVRSAVPIGNLLILSTSAVTSSFQALVMDISDPANPQQLNTFGGSLGYQPFSFGGKFYGGGTPLQEHDFSDPSNIVTTTLNPSPGFDRSEYGFGKDGHIFVGHYPGMTKWELNATATQQVQAVNSGIVDDHAFITPLGNLIVLASDHGNDRKLVLGIHDHNRDTTPPAVNFSSPADGETNVHVKSRVGLCFTDFIDHMTVDSSSLVVREFGTGTPVPGTCSTMFGIVNFAPDADLAPNTTYEVLLAANGVSDQAGNSNPAPQVVATFSTGAVISTYTAAVDPDFPRQPGQTANFILAVSNPAGFSLEHSWDFGDGSPQTAWSPSTTTSHLYNTVGNHTVTANTRIVGQTVSTQATGVQVVYAPLASTPPVHSSTIVYDQPNALVWNVNPDNGTVTAIHATTYSKVYETTVGNDPKTAALGPGNTLWVTNKADATLSVIDRGTGTVTRTHPLPEASAPHGIVIDPANSTAYVTLEATGELAKISTATGTVTATLPAGPWPRHLALDRFRNRLWVARFISPDSSGEVRAINTTSFTWLTTATLAPVLEPDSLTNGRGLPNYLGALAISPDVTQAFVPAKKDNIFRGMLRDGRQLTFEHTVRSMATRLDLATNAEDPAPRLDFDNNDFATAVAFSPLGNQVFFTTNGSAIVWVVDAYDPSNTFTFASGGLAPAGLVLSPDGSRLFVHNFMSRTVTVFDTSAVCATVCGTAPQVASVPTVQTEALAADVLLGKQFFYDSSDPRLSQESYMSCASCHLDGGHDGRTWDFTGMGEGLRNTIDLNGRGAGHGPVHWSANFDEIHDFEGQIRSLAGGTGLMSDADFDYSTRSAPLGLAKAGLSSDLDALAAYVDSLTTVGPSPHRGPGGTLTAAALAGREIFRASGCADCHRGPAFTDSESLARHDVGTLTGDSGQRLGAPLDGLDTPTLRGLWSGAPYLHDGSAPTIQDVLVTRNIAGLHGNLFALSAAELNQLEAYLLQIDDNETAAPDSGPNLPPILTDPGSQVSDKNTALTLPLAASDPENGPLEYFATGLPDGLALDRFTGVIAGSPALSGEFTARLSVRDGAGNSDAVTVAWTVNDGSVQLSEFGGPVGPYRYVKLVALSEENGNIWTTVAEFNVLDPNGADIDRTAWVVTASSEETSAEFAPATNAIDGDPNTFWHTQWAGSGVPSHPHELVADFGSPLSIAGFRYQPRTGGANGRIKDYEFHASTDAVNWDLITSGSFPAGAAAQTVQFSPITGSITREWWTGIGGNAVSALTGHPAFPDSPSGADTPSSFEAPTDWADSYGTRMHGFVVPTVTGDYTFAISSDDESELWLSTSHLPSLASRIANAPSWTSPREWTKYPQQIASTVTLQAGTLYYIMALQKEGSGGDNLAVGWQPPGAPGITVIPGANLIPFQAIPVLEPPAFDSPSYAFAVTEASAANTLVGTVTATDPDAGQSVSYSIVSGNTGGAFAIDSSSGEIRVAAPLDFETAPAFTLLVQATDDAGTPLSAAAEVAISVTNVLENNEEVVVVGITQPGGAYPGHGNPALVGYNADPDGDGIPNAIEILSGTNPSVADAPPGTRFGLELDGAKTYVTYEFDVDAAVDPVMLFRVFGSPDLGAWAELSAPPQLVADNGTTRTYRVRDDLALEDADRRFIRIGVNPAEGGE